jgi:hypothetical protein
LFSAITVEAWPGGSALFAVDTDGQVVESRDNGDSWSIIADVAPVSKGEFYRALVKDSVKLANVDDIVVSAAAAARFANIKSSSNGRTTRSDEDLAPRTIRLIDICRKSECRRGNQNAHSGEKQQSRPVSAQVIEAGAERKRACSNSQHEHTEGNAVQPAVGGISEVALHQEGQEIHLSAHHHAHEHGGNITRQQAGPESDQ